LQKTEQSMKKTYLTLLFMLFTIKTIAQEKAYLFTYFDNTKQDAGLLLAYSLNGYSWTAVNDNQPLMIPTLGKNKLLRDPSICQAPDGTFHLVWTTGWSDQIIGHATSNDLIHWSEQQTIPVMQDFPSARNSWAPELFYDKNEKKYWILWASTVPDNPNVKTEGCISESNYNHRIYCTTTSDFKNFSKTRLYFNPDFNAIDAAVIQDPKTDVLIMTVKNENLKPREKNIRITRSKRMDDGFPTDVSAPIHIQQYAEGPSPLFLENGDLIVFFDLYVQHKYAASVSHDHGKTWEDATDKIQMPQGMSHGTAIAVDKKIVDKLIQWDQNRK